eukprot:gene8584-8766_t
MQLYLRQFRCVGLWRAQQPRGNLNVYVEYAAVFKVCKAFECEPYYLLLTLKSVGGSQGPFDAGLLLCEDIVEGEPAELLVLCLDEMFVNFKTAKGAMFATFNVKVDRLTVMKTSLAEELILTGRAPAGSPKVISVVAFRHNVRSDARHMVSLEPSITKGTGFVPQMSVIAKFGW